MGAYTASVATPNNIYWCMENEGLDYFFGCPPLFVKRLTQENVERALKALIEDISSCPCTALCSKPTGRVEQAFWRESDKSRGREGWPAH